MTFFLQYLEGEDQVAELEQGLEVQLNTDLMNTCSLHTDTQAHVKHEPQTLTLHNERLATDTLRYYTHTLRYNTH